MKQERTTWIDWMGLTVLLLISAAGAAAPGMIRPGKTGFAGSAGCGAGATGAAVGSTGAGAAGKCESRTVDFGSTRIPVSTRG